MSTLNVKAWLGLVFLAVVMGLCLFIAAGTVDYWQGWIFLAVFFAASLVQTLYLMKYDPALLQRRLSGGPTAEKTPTQKLIMFIVSIGFVGLLVVPAFDHRFGWSAIPLYAVIGGDVLIAVGFSIVFLVFRENSFTSATIQIVKDQRVISTGPYAIVRHPQYAGAFLYLLGMPLALGSRWGLLVLAGMVPFLIWRLLDEEKLLARDLPGYTEYQRTVRSRLIPGIY
jgi:protein-S-isoprenylcysteine O-methyltransferase Ste14